jgi:hypothetical protein
VSTIITGRTSSPTAGFDRSTWRLVGGVGALAATVVVALALAAPAAVLAATPPPQDPFYTAPPNLGSHRPGSILRSRQVTVEEGPGALTGSSYAAYQLLYRSNDATGHPIANVTTLIVPTGTASKGGRKLVSLQDAEDSLDPDCAPSYQLQVGELDTADGDDNGNLAAEVSLVAVPQLEQGRDIVIPDPEGPDSEYNVTGIAAHVTLDSIRAVEQFAPAELDGAKTRVALAGYSGGGLETAAANELQPSYAPELKIIAVTAGGVPPFNEENVQYLDGSVAAGAVVAALIGIDRAYPQLDLYSLLNADGQSFAQKVLTGCASAVLDAPFTDYNTWTTVPNAFELPSVERVIATNALGHGIPTAPTFYYNAVNDEIVWIKPLDQLVAYDCAHNAHIYYYRDPAAVDHIEGAANWVPLANAYINDRFAGDPVPDTCGQPGNAADGTGLIPAPTSSPGSGLPNDAAR